MTEQEAIDAWKAANPAAMYGQQMAPGAVIPPRPSAPPLPPPPASGRGVAQRSTVDVTGATEALVVGPRDVLVISFPDETTMRELYEIRTRLLDSDLRPGQVLLVAGAEKIVRVETEESPYVRPRPAVLAQTIDGDAAQYRCNGCKEPIVRGERCGSCGRGWFIEEVKS